MKRLTKYECPRCHMHNYKKTAIFVELLSGTKKDVLTCNKCGKEFKRKYSNTPVKSKKRGIV